MPLRRWMFVLLSAGAVLALTAASQRARYFNTELPPGVRAHDLVARMTLEVEM